MTKTRLLLTGLLLLSSASAAFAIDYLMSTSSNTVPCGTVHSFFDDGGSSNYGSNRRDTMVFYPENPGEYVEVDFSYFNLHNGDVDYLAFYDGTSTDAPLLGRFYDDASPESIGATNSDGALTVVFYSDGSGSGSGWVASVQCAAAPVSQSIVVSTNGAIIKTCDALFFDNGKYENYSATSQDTMVFYPETPGEYVRLIFTYFNIEDDLADHLYFYDGTSTGAPLLGRYDDDVSPDTIGATNSDGALTVVFSSTPGGSSSMPTGWIAEVDCATEPVAQSAVVMTNGATITTCQGTFYDDGKFEGYDDETQDTMVFYPATPGAYVQLDFTYFNLESDDADHLSIYDGTSTSAPLLGKFYEEASPDVIGATNSDGALTVVFTSVSGGSAGGPAGWVADISCVSDPVSQSVVVSTNGITVNSCGTMFYDDGKFDNYSPNRQDTIVFLPDALGESVTLIFSFFDLQNDGVDQMIIYDGSSTSATRLGNFYNNTSPDTVRATNADGALTVVFVSDSGGTGGNPRGWVAEATCSIASDPQEIVLSTNGLTTTTCHALFYDNGQAGNYASNRQDTMVFYPGNPGEYVMLTFSSFKLRNDKDDYLSIYDGASTDAPLLGRFYSETSPEVIGATNDDGALTVVFYSGSNGTSQGWAAEVSCSSEPVYPSIVVSTDGAAITTCDATFYDDGKFLNYSPSRQDTMVFYPQDSGEYVSLSFSSYNLQDDKSDYLSIYDGTTTDAPLVGSYYDDASPEIVGATNEDGALTVVFYSNSNSNGGSSQGWGWTASVGCSFSPVPPTVITSTNQASAATCGATFYDDGKFDDYGNNRQDTLFFYPENDGEIVVLDFTLFNLQDDLTDNLSIYDGIGTDAPLLGSYFGNTSPGIVSPTNSDGALTVIFSSDGGGSGGTPEGWSAEVTCLSSTFPVRLSSFVVQEYEGQVAIRWSTALEANNDYFTVERSQFGNEWQTVEIVPSSVVNSTAHTAYQTVDIRPLEGVSYYRLKQTDLDGTFTYSNVRAVRMGAAALYQVAVYPNPSNGHFHVSGSNLAEHQVQVFDLNGKDITAQTAITMENEQLLSVDLGRQQNGIYVLRHLNQTIKIVKR